MGRHANVSNTLFLTKDLTEALKRRKKKLMGQLRGTHTRKNGFIIIINAMEEWRPQSVSTKEREQ